METVYQSTSTLQAQEGICVAIRMRPLNERELNKWFKRNNSLMWNKKPKIVGITSRLNK